MMPEHDMSTEGFDWTCGVMVDRYAMVPFKTTPPKGVGVASKPLVFESVAKLIGNPTI